MDTRIFDALMRQAAASRRGSIRALGGAALAAGLAAPMATRAGKAGKKCKERCKRQRGQCQAFLKTICEPKADPWACEEGARPCCEPFARCNAGAGITCLFEAVLA